MTATGVQLRQWQDADVDSFSKMNADADVMRFFIAPWNPEESRQALHRFRRAIDERGGGGAVDVDGAFAGFAGSFRTHVRSSFHAVRGNRLAVSPRVLGKGYRTCSGTKGGALRFHGLATRRAGFVYDRTKRPVSTDDGAIGVRARPQRRFLASQGGRRPSAVQTRPLQKTEAGPHGRINVATPRWFNVALG
jgi:hypothetical protein